MVHRVLVSDPIHRAGVELLRNKGFEVTEASEIAADELVSLIQEFDALIVRGRTKVTRLVVENGARLRLVARAGVGLDNIDVEACKSRRVEVVSTPEAPTQSVAELAIGLILAVLRRVALADKLMKDGKWTKQQLMGTELRGRKVGIVGIAGRIGTAVARIAGTGFGSEIHGYDVVRLEESCKKLGATPHRNLDSLVRAADVVSLHVPYSKATHHLLSKQHFDMMPQNAVVVNTSRGEVLDGQALLEALKRSKIAGAGLDVYSKEPPADPWEKELVSLPNVVCTPHIGAQTEDCQRAESRAVAEQIISFFA